MPDEFIDQLRTNNAIWSAFRTHRMQNDIAAKLFDEDGKLKKFEQWVKDIKGMTNHYVDPWLRTEYNTAILRAHQAADWKHFVDEQDVFPNVRWMPTTSPQQDPLHRQYWEKKLTLPVNHPFWEKHHPGDRWNCKCSLQQTDEPVNDEVIKDFYPVPQEPGLDNNPGKDGKLFSNTHPYISKAYPGAKAAVEDILDEKTSNMRVRQESVLTKKVREEVDELLENVKNKRTVNRMTVLTRMPKDVRCFLKGEGITPESMDITVSDRRIGHALRDSKKARGKAVSEKDLADALSNLDKCEVFYDRSHKNIWYVYDNGKELQKYVFGFDTSVKVDGERFKINEMVTAGIIEPRDLTQRHMVKIR